jgi:hypothetical protein
MDSIDAGRQYTADNEGLAQSRYCSDKMQPVGCHRHILEADQSTQDYTAAPGNREISFPIPGRSPAGPINDVKYLVSLINQLLYLCLSFFLRLW